MTTEDKLISIDTDSTITITVDDISEDAVYALLYNEPLWPEVIGE